MRILTMFLDLTNGAIKDLLDFSPSFWPYGPRESGPSGKPEAPILRAIEGSQ
jgi:hypothetical protein